MHTSRPIDRIEAVVGVGALAMATGAFTGHLLVPDRVADHYGWNHDRWYQREIGAFNAGLGFGVLAYARGRPDTAFLGSWGVAAAILALTRAPAIKQGARRGRWNIATVIEDGALGVGALILLLRLGRSR